jgi:hypothetical protein
VNSVTAEEGALWKALYIEDAPPCTCAVIWKPPSTRTPTRTRTHPSRVVSDLSTKWFFIPWISRYRREINKMIWNEEVVQKSNSFT